MVPSEMATSSPVLKATAIAIVVATLSVVLVLDVLEHFSRKCLCRLPDVRMSLNGAPLLSANLSSLVPVFTTAINRADRLDLSWRPTLQESIASVTIGCPIGKDWSRDEFAWMSTVQPWSPATSNDDVNKFDVAEYYKVHENSRGARFGPFDDRGSVDYVDDDTGERRTVHFVQNHRMPEFDTPEIPGDVGYANEAYGHVSIFKGAHVTNALPLVYDCKTLWFPGGCLPSVHDNQFAAHWNPDMLKQPKVALSGAVVLIAQFWGNNYYHFLNEDFFRLAVVYEYLMENPHVRILTYHHSTAEALFTLIGIPVDRCVWYNPALLYVVETLLVPQATVCGRSSHVALNFMKNLFRRKFLASYYKGVEPMNDANRRNIVLHQRIGSREIVNHEQLLARLQAELPNDSVMVFPPNPGMLQAIDIHYRADLIVGPHGAGMTNFVFARNHSIGVVELHPFVGGGEHALAPPWKNPCYIFLTERSGGSWRGIVSPPGPLIVDIDRTMELVHELLMLQKIK